MDGRPGTGMRGGGPLGPIGGTMGPPGTAMRPPTGMRQPLGTAALRMGTAMRPGSRAGLGPLNTNIQVAERPVTQQGMMGMKPVSQGPGRQIQDRSYYMGELRKRCDELNSEINKMNGEAEQYNKDNEQYTKYEKKYNALIGEVRKLQGDLADLNLIADKSRNNTDPQDIDNAYQHLRQANAEESQRCDAILMERKHKEAETEELEKKIREFQQAEREKLSTLSADLQRKYGELQDNQKRLQADEDKLRMQFNNVCMQLGSIEEEVKADRNKQRLIEMQAQKLALQERVAKLEKEVNKPVLSDAEMKEQLLEQVKRDKESTSTYERNADALEQRIKQAEEELEKLESGGGAADSEDAKKYQKLQEKDKEMTEFIDKFDDTMQKESQAVLDLEHRIVQVLNYISKDLGRQQQLPSKEGFLDMQNEVALKQRGLDNSQTTAERLSQEQTMRKAELDKIENLDKKIGEELKTLNERSATMKEELKTFGNIPQLREEAETNKRNMMARKTRLDGLRKALKMQVQLLSAEYDKHKQALATNESAGTLEALETKLRHYEQNIYHLRDFIDSKEAETDYSGVYEEVSKQVADINAMLQQLHSRPY